MAKQIEGVYEKILECATEEFLEKGFKDASLRVIAAKANTSTNSIYVRFKDKEGLFQTIVEPAANQMMKMFLEIQEEFHNLDDEIQEETMVRYSLDGMDKILNYIYDNFSARCV